MHESLARFAPRATPAPDAPALQRSQGDARLAFKRRGSLTVLADLYQAGCAKVRFPRAEPGCAPQAVLINTAGGLTDRDRLAHEVAWREGATAVVASQAAERIYRSRAAPAIIRTGLDVGEDATALWLPQETILFDGARLDRRNEVDLAPAGRLLACEALVFGRAAMGETVRSGFVSDSWRIRVNGRLVFAEGFRLDGGMEDALKRPAVAAGARAVATVIYVGPDAEQARDIARSRLGAATNDAACSCLGMVTIARLLARSGLELRKALTDLLAALIGALDTTERLALPKVWAL